MYLSVWVTITSSINLQEVVLKLHLSRFHNWRASDIAQYRTGGKTRENQGMGCKCWRPQDQNQELLCPMKTNMDDLAQEERTDWPFLHICVLFGALYSKTIPIHTAKDGLLY